MPKADVYEVKYTGDPGGRNSLLSRELYSTDRDAVDGSWHIISALA
jgi:hypothetical protein